jgi:arylsulfatase A
VTEVDGLGNITVNGPTNRAMMVQENDIIVGYMLDFLEQTDDPRNPGHKLIDNTIFIFTSDNGADIRSEAAVGALPQSSDGVITDIAGFKGTRWEGGNRVPFIAAWPHPGDAQPGPDPREQHLLRASSA